MEFGSEISKKYQETKKHYWTTCDRVAQGFQMVAQAQKKTSAELAKIPLPARDIKGWNPDVVNDVVAQIQILSAVFQQQANNLMDQADAVSALNQLLCELKTQALAEGIDGDTD